LRLKYLYKANQKMLLFFGQQDPSVEVCAARDDAIISEAGHKKEKNIIRIPYVNGIQFM